MRDPASLCPLDMGFDPRDHGMLVRLTHLPVRYRQGSGPGGKDLITSEDREAAAEVLARAGYSIVAYQTATGRDVQCTPREHAPPGDWPAEPWRGPVWSVQARRDNYWVHGRSLAEALERAGWRPDEVTPIERGET